MALLLSSSGGLMGLRKEHSAFLFNECLIRNAASKVFQAWKPLVAALAVDKKDEIENRYKGVVKFKGVRR